MASAEDRDMVNKAIKKFMDEMLAALEPTSHSKAVKDCLSKYKVFMGSHWARVSFTEMTGMSSAMLTRAFINTVDDAKNDSERALAIAKGKIWADFIRSHGGDDEEMGLVDESDPGTPSSNSNNPSGGRRKVKARKAK